MYILPDKRICTSCLKEKPLNEFHLDRGRPRSICKTCSQKDCKSKRTGIRLKKIYILPKMKICSQCNKEKDINDFYIQKNNKPKSNCKSCHQLNLSLWRKKNPKIHSKQNCNYQKTYHSKHPEYLKSWWKKTVKEASPTYIRFGIMKGRGLEYKTASDITVQFIRSTLMLRREINAQGKSPFKDAGD